MAINSSGSSTGQGCFLITDEIANASPSIKFMNMAFAVKELVSKFELPTGRDHKSVTQADTVTVHRLERIMPTQAGVRNVPVNVLVWDLMDTGDPLSFLLFDRVDTADEVRGFFQGTSVETDTNCGVFPGVPGSCRYALWIDAAARLRLEDA